MSRFGMLSGTFRKPSMSSLNASSFDGRPVSSVNACLTQVVRATSPNVPICGSPDGPYPVSNSALSLPEAARRRATFRASSNGHAFGISGNTLRSVSDMAGSYGPGCVRSIATIVFLHDGQKFIQAGTLPTITRGNRDDDTPAHRAFDGRQTRFGNRRREWHRPRH